MRKHLYLDFTRYKRTPKLMEPLSKEIVPGFESVKGLNMVDASQLHHFNTTNTEPLHASGD